MEPNTWTDRGSVGIRSDSSNPYNAIDANLVDTGGSTYYMNFWIFLGWPVPGADGCRGNWQSFRIVIL
jgi:hypothetical protein